MKYKFLLPIIFSLCFSTLFAQSEQVSSHKLNWKAVEKCSSDSLSFDIISFEGARYPYENMLPCFNQQITCDPAYLYVAELKNPVYIPLTSQETSIIAGKQINTSEAEVKTNLLYERNTTYFDIHIIPFANQSGQILKLESFDLVIKKTLRSQKIVSSTKHTYTSSSVLAQGKFVKIKISDSGIYKLTYKELTSMGVDPTNVRVFGYGGGVLEQSFLLPKIDDLPEVAIWNGGDYILFYAQGVNRWGYDKSISMFTHQINTYSQYGYYFVTSDAGIGRKISDKTVSAPQSSTIVPVDNFVDYQVYEKDNTTIIHSGKVLYDNLFENTNTAKISFNFPNQVLSNTTKVRLDVAAAALNPSTFTLNLDGFQAKLLSVNAKSSTTYDDAIGNSAVYNFTPVSDALIFNLSYSRPTATSEGYLNYLEVNTRRELIMSGSTMQFQNVDYLDKGYYSQYLLSNANTNVQIWDITDPQNINRRVTENVNGKLTFVDSSNDEKHYLAIDPTVSSAFPSPEIVGDVPNQNLHAIAQADMVIIAYPDFVPQAQTLAQAHREKDNLSVEVVTPDQVYNEFSSGTPDATAYRWIMKMLYDRSTNTNDLPKYLLLFGRGTYDNRGIIPSSGDNLILTYQTENSLNTIASYVSDDYFGLLNDEEGTNISSDRLDIGIGRFPVTTTQQATDVVNKTIGYMNNTDKGNWKNQVCFLGDDGGNNGDGIMHMEQADNAAIIVTNKYPAYQVNKVYLDAFQQEYTASGESYPAARSKFLNLLRSGLFLVNYTGHGGPVGWSNENVFSIADAKSLANKHLPLFMGATCDFSLFDVKTVSGGEEIILNPTGGGIGIFAAARAVLSANNSTLNKYFCEKLFEKQNGQQLRIGDVVRLSKNSTGSEINKLSYVYLGDPAVKLNYPTKYQVLTSKVNESISLGSDTLRALSVATIQGFIADENGNKVDNFNGTIHATAYDKVQQTTTLNNHSDGALTYSDRPNTLFSGDAEVKNGVYSFTFMLPKDIKYNYGAGRIDYYAQDDINDYEAQGFFENFCVGGTDNYTTVESNGPDVQLFMNSENFVSGDKVNETPQFIANISDVNGINTVGSGIGHDVLLTIDNDSRQSYVLNEFFQSKLNSFTEGTVKYNLSELTNGSHSLTLRAWNLLNFSSSKTIQFEVEKGLTPKIFNVYNFPNPVKIETKIVVTHDRPETILKTTVEIFDLSGRAIWSFTQANADDISWNLTANDGRKVKAGVYLYRVSIKTVDSDISSKANKMVVIE